MQKIVKLRWWVLALWIAAVVVLLMAAPSMTELVREKGQITVPEGYSSTYADELLRDWNVTTGDTEAGGASGETSSNQATAVLVFHNPEGLTKEDELEIVQGIEALEKQSDAIGITDLVTHLDMPELEEQLVSADGKTVLAMVTIESKGRVAAEMSESLYAPLKDLHVEHYYTGDWIINEDVITSSEEGLRRTEVITVVFILTILFVVFRSAIAPFIPLISVGISYLAAQSVVAFLAEYANFPLSNFTQIFMVAVMFGIGTDYCILLISRFREELAQTGDNVQAVLNTYRTAGKTVLVAGLAVLVGFTAIGFSTFVLYRSAVAVAVGVAVLLLALITLVPFFMAAFGKAIFWPIRGTLTHKPSRLWESIGSFSLRRPFGALLLLAVLIVPFLIAYQGSVSFNSLDEIGSRYDSVKGFEVIAESFGPGDTLPTTVVVKADQAFDNQEGLAAIERVSRELTKLDGVKMVRSATRPTGEPLQDFQVADQLELLSSGLEEGIAGLDQLEQGLAVASSSIAGNAPQLQEAAAGADELVRGTSELRAGVQQLGEAIAAIEAGLVSGKAGAAELEQGMRQAEASARQLAQSVEALVASYQQLESGLGELQAGYAAIAESQKTLSEQLTRLSQGFAVLADRYPDLQEDDVFLTMQAGLPQLEQGAAALARGLQELNTQLATAGSGLQEANAGLTQLGGGQTALAQGLLELAEGMAELRVGIEQAASGQGQIAGQVPQFTNGFNELIAGQQAFGSGFAELEEQLEELVSGLDEGVSGLRQVSEGLAQAQSFLDELSAMDGETGGWYVPEEAFEMSEFQSALDVYMSADRRTTKLEVVLNGNPYATESIDQIDSFDAAVGRGLNGTAYAQAEMAIGGVTSMNHDLRTISSEDYTRTAILMLIGIALILIVLFRSLVMPIYLMLSLIVTYFTSMAITEVIFVRLAGYDGLTWAVPFFAFVMLMALGVDYSIFLMDRFKEYRDLPPQEGILEAMRHMGTVIISAAVILGGTFAAMLPSGVLSLLQIATVVICGLFLYAMFMLPLFIPVMVRWFGEANWWPFMQKR